MTILVADDNSKNRELLRTVLSHLGHSVTEACDGQQALDAAASCQPDVIILDLQMPVMDGYETARLLRAGNHPRTPLIAVTAYAMHGDRERALAAGFTSYLSKPVRLAAIRAELARWSEPHE